MKPLICASPSPSRSPTRGTREVQHLDALTIANLTGSAARCYSNNDPYFFQRESRSDTLSSIRDSEKADGDGGTCCSSVLSDDLGEVDFTDDEFDNNPPRRDKVEYVTASGKIELEESQEDEAMEEGVEEGVVENWSNGKSGAGPAYETIGVAKSGTSSHVVAVAEADVVGTGASAGRPARIGAIPPAEAGETETEPATRRETPGAGEGTTYSVPYAAAAAATHRVTVSDGAGTSPSPARRREAAVTRTDPSPQSVPVSRLSRWSPSMEGDTGAVPAPTRPTSNTPPLTKFSTDKLTANRRREIGSRATQVRSSSPLSGSAAFTSVDGNGGGGSNSKSAAAHESPPKMPAVPTVTCKVLVVGNAKCGKSSIISRFVSDRFSPDYNSTVGADYAKKDVTLEDGRLVGAMFQGLLTRISYGALPLQHHRAFH